MQNIDTSKTEWNLSPLGAGDNDPKFSEKREAIHAANYAFINKWKDRDDYLKDPAVLKEALDESEALTRKYGISGDEGYYFSLRGAQDEDNTELKARESKIHDFSLAIANGIQFFGIRVAKIPKEEQKKFLEYPPLASYRHDLERAFANAKYLLTEPEEKILNLTAKPSSGNWEDMVSRFVYREERETLGEDGVRTPKNFNEILSLTSSVQKPVRDEAASHIHEILSKHADVAEAEINSILETKKISDDLRGVKRPDESRHVSDDIDTEVVDALVKAAGGQFDIARRYYALKARLMNIPKLAYHERNVPYAFVEKKYSYPDAAKLVYDVFLELDSLFAAIFKQFVEEGLIDVFPKKGKTGGAFCAHVLLSQPTYILLNHTEKLHDVLTLAHESGHGINNELIRKKQHAFYFDTPVSTAEVASTFMEDFVLERLTKDADDELRLSLMLAKLNDDVSTIFRQIALYRFEQELHAAYREKGYLSKEEIGVLFQKHMHAYMGDAVEQSPGSENWWVYWSHIRDFFYVYSYASGLLISKAMQAAVRNDKSFIEKVKEFLSAGTSDSPKNIFAKMGIDITNGAFWESGLNEVNHLLGETEALAKKLGKI
ncbi:MAG: M3 family oligoendopeptidase [Candidatus Lloydbacteria bacterium]|nr:M3 family oligoendopeptidase [Candidatus Lloydbacteria bacterium]